MAASSTRFFDANCRLGPDPLAPKGSPANGPELLRAMDAAGIAEALVYSSIAHLYMPAAGNARILAETAGYDRLHPCWALLPETTGEMPQRCVEQMLSAGVRAARLCPAAHRFSLSPEFCGGLLARLEAARVPVFVDYGVGHWSGREVPYPELAGVCEAFPELPVVLAGVGVADDRMLFPLMERCPNLRLELSYYQAEQGIEETLRRFGVHRLLFGTGMPKFPPGGAITYVTYARISDAERAAVAGDNLRTLLEGVRL